jgi:hypothetical protein
MLVNRTCSLKLGTATEVVAKASIELSRPQHLMLHVSFAAEDRNLFHAHYVKGKSVVTLRDPDSTMIATVAWIWWDKQMREIEGIIKKYVYKM